MLTLTNLSDVFDVDTTTSPPSVEEAVGAWKVLSFRVGLFCLHIGWQAYRCYHNYALPLCTESMTCTMFSCI